MPFNIELNSKTIPIKIQVVKKTITTYFNEHNLDGLNLRAKWMSLANQFIKDIPEAVTEDEASSSGTYHMKQAHTQEGESQIYHTHTEFKIHITPELFACYLKNMHEQQEKHGVHFKFFEKGEVESIIQAFTEYYNEYKGSAVEQQFEHETKLTEKELEQENGKKTVQVSAFINNRRHTMFLPKGGIPIVFAESSSVVNRPLAAIVNVDVDQYDSCKLM